ncbi:hypothetical protein GTC6_16820, partial [Gordonia terrae C-6]
IARSGPDEGRCVWTLNAEPGAPPNPDHINRRPDIPRRFTTHLNTVRKEIHGPTTRPGDQACRSWLTISHVIDVRPPRRVHRTRLSLVEAHLEDLLSRDPLVRNATAPFRSS